MIPSYKTTGVLRGYIYNGELKKYALNRVLFVGDSGALTPPAIAMGFNEVLRKNELIAHRVTDHMVREQFSEHQLSDVLLDHRSSMRS